MFWVPRLLGSPSFGRSSSVPLLAGLRLGYSRGSRANHLARVHSLVALRLARGSLIPAQAITAWRCCHTLFASRRYRSRQRRRVFGGLNYSFNATVTCRAENPASLSGALTQALGTLVYALVYSKSSGLPREPISQLQELFVAEAVASWHETISRAGCV